MEHAHIRARWSWSIICATVLIIAYLFCYIYRLQEDRNNDQVIENLLMDAHGRTNTAIVAINEDSVICGWNQGATKVFGYSHDEAHGKKLSSILLMGDMAKYHDAAVHKALSEHVDYPKAHVKVGTCSARCKDGTIICVYIRVYVASGGGFAVGEINPVCDVKPLIGSPD